MEEPPEIRDIPLSVLRDDTLRILSMRLNIKCDTLMPGCERVADYRGLAELYEKGTPYIMFLEEKSDPTGQLLKSLRGKEATLSTLWQNLQQLGRTDILKDCRELFKRDTERWHHRRPRDHFEAEHIKNENKRSTIRSFFERPLSGKEKPDAHPPKKEETVVYSRDQTVECEGKVTSGAVGNMSFEPGQPRRPVQGEHCQIPRPGDCPSGQPQQGASNSVCKDVPPAQILSIDDIGNDRPQYDAYINYADEDILKAKDMCNILEQPPYNLHLFLPDRQLMPGGSKYEDIAAVVEDRCRGKVVIILTRHYNRSEACQFVTNFARALDPASKNKRIIPILYEAVSVPQMLKGMYLITKQKDEKRGWFWKKLKEAIQQ